MISGLILNALLAGTMAGSLCGCTGVLCTRMGVNTIAFATAHAALAGAALSLVVGGDPIVLGLVLALVTAVILGPLSDHLRIPLDITSMSMFSVYNALTFIFLIISPGATLASEKVGQILWGSVLAVTLNYLIVLTTLTVIYILFLVVFWGRISSILFNPKLAEAEGVNVKAYTYALVALAGAVTVFTLRITGGFLVFSLLFIPAASALQLSENIRKIVLAASLLRLTSAITGVGLSFTLHLPVGSCIVIGAATILAVAATLSVFKRKRLLKTISFQI
ncbi:hypothetical protein DRO26_00625 [Candidatus Bathyarchaeota archaeon]|nr:MAG: hypothetical protein DRO26_00625 [Candidatus Bathyarchaeota archaeon]